VIIYFQPYMVPHRKFLQEGQFNIIGTNNPANKNLQHWLIVFSDTLFIARYSTVIIASTLNVNFVSSGLTDLERKVDKVFPFISVWIQNINETISGTIEELWHYRFYCLIIELQKIPFKLLPQKKYTL
jgi:hypothetical protein